MTSAHAHWWVMQIFYAHVSSRSVLRCADCEVAFERGHPPAAPKNVGLKYTELCTAALLLLCRAESAWHQEYGLRPYNRFTNHQATAQKH